jgi:hypothetical protein
MNIYVRFFDFDTLVSDKEGVIQFLQSLPDVELTDEIIEEIKDYINSDTTYPKRLKIRPHIYFILIKTIASSMEEFKANRKDSFNALNPQGLDLTSRKEIKVTMLQEENFGWYRGALTFKRVVLIPGTNKFQYQDTIFEALVQTMSGKECYDAILSHLKNRNDVDPRSQFPSCKGSNFDFEYMGENPFS